MTVVQHLQHRVGELEETERVGHRRPVATDRDGDVLLGQLELGDEPLVTARLVHGREIVPLQVLDQRERQHRAVVDDAPDRGDLLPAERLTGPQPALSGDQLES